jgi:hypothetical protein
MTTLLDLTRDFKVHNFSEEDLAAMPTHLHLATQLHLSPQCGHPRTLKVRSIIRGTSCFQCTNNRKLAAKYPGLVLDFVESAITCNLCQRRYNRDPDAFTKDLARWSCFCSMKRQAEMEVFDLLTEHFQGHPTQKLFRGFRGYNVGRNFSSDFHLRGSDGFTTVLHLDDKSHYNAVNRGRDIEKLTILLENGGHRNFYFEQAAFLETPEQALAHLDAELEANTLVSLFRQTPGFYGYLRDFLDFVFPPEPPL